MGKPGLAFGPAEAVVELMYEWGVRGQSMIGAIHTGLTRKKKKKKQHKSTWASSHSWSAKLFQLLADLLKCAKVPGDLFWRALVFTGPYIMKVISYKRWLPGSSDGWSELVAGLTLAYSECLWKLNNTMPQKKGWNNNLVISCMIYYFLKREKLEWA